MFQIEPDGIVAEVRRVRHKSGDEMAHLRDFGGLPGADFGECFTVSHGVCISTFMPVVEHILKSN
jgi:hypothetical protein